MQIFTSSHLFNADEYTPVGLYLQLRDHFRKACLLESNDYHDRTESSSIIGLEPIVEIQIIDQKIIISLIETAEKKTFSFDPTKSIEKQIQSHLEDFSFDSNFELNGFFGRVGFEFALLTEDHIIKKEQSLDLPHLHLFVFKYLIIIDHFNDKGQILKNSLSNSAICEREIELLLLNKPYTSFPFDLIGEESNDLNENEFLKLVEKAKKNCERGDVFQLVISNAYSQKFFGDEFNVYRNLRRLNPSPYLFFFDFEDYRLFGSSPEAQLKIKNGKAEIHPIAGTMPKTGDQNTDEKHIELLRNDEKENAEHTMLVDLARNDLSKSCENVKVETYKEIQRFSHVFHIVSKVTGISVENKSFPLFNQSFPAGTLSGSPKPKALELISKYEKTTRDFYGGAIGFFNPRGDLNMAIVIRSVLTMNNTLYYRAGAGIVLDSDPKMEFQEVQNKLKAVRMAIKSSVSNLQNSAV